MSSRQYILEVPVDVMDQADLSERSLSLLSSAVACQAITVNALLVLGAKQNPALMAACQNAALMLPESAGIRWALSRQKINAITVAGIDYAWQLCELCAAQNWSVFLLGGTETVLQSAAARLRSEISNLKIVGMHDGFFDASRDLDIVSSIQATRPHLILVALGMPKQDLWISKYLPHLPGGLYIGVGGSFDIWAGRLKRAPRWIQLIGAEWIYRLCQEPWRWSRIMLLPQFVWKVLREPVRRTA